MQSGEYPSSSTCGDYMFSGHTVLLLITVQAIDRYGGSLRWGHTFSLIMWVNTVLGLVAIIATRLHYTIDVIVAFILTVGLFRSYHHNADLQRLVTQVNGAGAGAGLPGGKGAQKLASPSPKLTPPTGRAQRAFSGMMLPPSSAHLFGGSSLASPDTPEHPPEYPFKDDE